MLLCVSALFWLGLSFGHARISQILMTFRTVSTSSSASVEMELCFTLLRSSRYCALSGFRSQCIFAWTELIFALFLSRRAFHQLWPFTWAPWVSSRRLNLTPTSPRSPRSLKVLKNSSPTCSFPCSKVCKAYSVVLFNAGNAAIVLRSRLKVRVLKENREKKAQLDEKGIILTNGDMESSWKAVQYQVKRVT